MPYEILESALAACTLVSLAYLAFAIACVRRFPAPPGRPAANRPPVTILKPVCGLEPGLYENLRSFCEQDYPSFQVVFGLASPSDPAVPVIERLIRELPDRDLRLCVDAHAAGPNLKVSNVANMYPLARHDLIVVADADMRVGPDYLDALARAFEDPEAGAATCLYTGVPSGGLASDFGAAFINEWFLPSVLVAHALNPIHFCFGATMAIRRDVLERIGGFTRLASVLADDFMLGRLVSELGYRVQLSPYLVRNVVEEPGLRSLFLHELRWARTVRTVQPWGYMFSFVTYPVPMSLVLLAAAPHGIGLAALGGAIALRLLMHGVARKRLGLDRQLHAAWVPLRDLLSFAIWGASFLGRRVRWRQSTFGVTREGDLLPQETRAS